ncbi:GTPase IMAP family member 7 [Megalops cyprinoides]|uniref:GTPase IMAP family member 7 n=1 Tax=Megalops cyprinoides TaxID=118141 RepID=UPI0018646ED1|nr:GTPase IMAP family member 7 [Megalops cyprinoides]
MSSPPSKPDVSDTSSLPENPASNPASLSSSPSSSPAPEELRLVLLGRRASGKSAAGNAILGREVFLSQKNDDEVAVTQECEKRRGVVAGRQVAVIDTPDWFCSKRPREEVRRQISACAALSAPGPHAFLLCVPLDRPAEVELQALGALGEVFGPGAVSGHTLVLFTHADEVAEAGGAEDYIANQREDLLELTERCGDRYHVLEVGGGAEGAGGEAEGAESSVCRLLEKVEQIVRDGGGAHYTSSLFQEAEARVLQRQEEIMKEHQARKEEGEGEGEEEQEEEEEQDEAKEREQVREEAERSVHDLTLDTIPALFASSPPPSFLRSIWETLVGWVRAVTKYIRREALLGSVVGMLVGGPLGSALGATVGSVATEVGRRKHVKKQ